MPTPNGRLLRIPALEAGIYAVGRLECAELFPNEEDSVRKQLTEAKVFLTYQRQLNNLSVQENRLRRQREKDTAKLREIQGQRRLETRNASTRLRVNTLLPCTTTALRSLLMLCRLGTNFQ